MPIPGIPPGMPPPGAIPGMKPPGPSGGPSMGAGPTPSPMQTPQPAAGLAQNSKIQVQMALDMLQQSLPGLGVTTPEGQAVLNALKILSKTFGSQEAKNRELIPTEIMQLLASLPQAGGASPGQRQIASAPPPGAGAPPLPI